MVHPQFVEAEDDLPWKVTVAALTIDKALQG
jgi:hypothetical protein